MPKGIKGFLKGHTTNIGRKMKESVRINLINIKKGVPKTEEQKEKQRIKMKGRYVGSDNPNWRGGKSFDGYSIEWINTLKISIRERDKYTCQICSIKQGDISHDVHHIDYDKNNCSPNNLITLCKSCHSKTNFNRDNWLEYFNKLMILK